MMEIISELKREDLQEKKVLLRVDFNCAVDGGEITEPFKIERAKETIEYLLYHGARVALLSHNDIGSFEGVSFKPMVQQIARILGQSLIFVPDCVGAPVASAIAERSLVLLENARLNEGELKNDPEFAQTLAKPFDIYVNDAFAVAHREHASVVAVTKYLPSYAGMLMKSETRELSRALDAPPAGKVLVLGGAKISTKLPVIKNFQDKAEKILIGGAIANNFFKFHDLEIGKSLVDDNFIAPIAKLDRKIIRVPEDVIVSTDKAGAAPARAAPEKGVLESEYILDIGPETTRLYADIIRKAEMVIWNGPMGMSEVPIFAQGTRIIAEAVASLAKDGESGQASRSRSIIGGGDTIAAITRFGMMDRFAPVPRGVRGYRYISTGGGAMLEFLAGNRLPALEALGYYENVE